MKRVVFILAVCIISCSSVSFGSEKYKKLRAYKDACIAQTGVDEAAVNAHYQIISAGEKVTHDPKLDCYFFCFLKMIGFQRDCGKIDTDRFLAKAKSANLNVPEVTEILNKCKERTGKDGCETAGNLVHCFVENNKFHELYA